MAIVFGKPASSQSKSVRPVLADAFERDVTVVDESDADSGPSGNAPRVITNYRGFTRDKAGRKAALIHQTVIDLGFMGQPIPLGELRDAAARLSKLADELEEAGVLGGKGNPLLRD
jgi:hypothetical protein